MKAFFVFLLIACPFLASAQASSFFSWNIDPSDLISGKVVLQQPEDKTLNFTVRVQRFLKPGSSTEFEAVNLTIKLGRLPDNSNAYYDISSPGTITSSVYTNNTAIFADVSISLVIKSAGTTEDVLQNDDQIVLLIQNGSGWTAASNTYEVIINPANTPDPEQPSFTCMSRGWSSDVPGSPSNLRYSVLINPYKIHLIWDDNSNSESGYTIIRANPDNSFSQFHLPPNSTEYTDESIVDGNRYGYEVHLFGNANAWSNRLCLYDLVCFENSTPQGGWSGRSLLKVENSIEVTDYTMNSGSITFQAGESILIGPNTQFEMGAVMHASIVPCFSESSSSRIRTHEPYMVLPQAATNENSVKFIVFPNPTSGYVTIGFDCKDDCPKKVNLNSVNGLIVKSWNIDLKGNERAELDIRDVANGIYYLTFFKGTRSFHFQKLIINK